MAELIVRDADTQSELWRNRTYKVRDAKCLRCGLRRRTKKGWTWIYTYWSVSTNKPYEHKGFFCSEECRQSY